MSHCHPVGLVALFALLALSCATPDTPHETLRTLWFDYEALPSERALSVAGHLRRGQWVAGMAGGLPTRAEAEDVALRRCGEERHRLRMQEPCRLYAVGDEIVWPAGR